MNILILPKENLVSVGGDARVVSSKDVVPLDIIGLTWTEFNGFIDTSEGRSNISKLPDWVDPMLKGWENYLPQPPSKEQQEAHRQAAFQAEADPLFFKWQAGESTEAEWLEKREEIRLRYPYPA